MILINLLPPELRKRKTNIQFNPMMAGAAAGLLVSLVALAFFLWIKLKLLPDANAFLAEKQDELAVKTAQAEEVKKLEAQIADFENRRDTLFTLLGRKMYWARTIDEFSRQLTGEWSVPGFQVSAGDLTLAEIASPRKAAGAKGPEEVLWSFRWRYKIVGTEDQKSGDYIQSFFKTIERSPFWSDHGFVGKPEDRYDGDRPRLNDRIGKVIVEGGLDWQRMKLAEFSTTKGAKSPQGN